MIEYRVLPSEILSDRPSVHHHSCPLRMGSDCSLVDLLQQLVLEELFYVKMLKYKKK